MNRVIAALLAGAAITMAAPVLAADLVEPVPVAPIAEPIVEATAFDWTGAYIGAAVGYGWADSDVVSTVNGAGTVEADDFTAGIFAGYNWAVTPQWVVGAEADVFFAPEQDFAIGGTNYSLDSQYFSTVRGRLGYAFGNFMVYGTGGVALGWAELESGGVSDDNLHVGYTVGAGLEAALTQNVTARVEYNWLDLGSEDYSVGAGDVVSGDVSGHMIKAGVAYKF